MSRSILASLLVLVLIGSLGCGGWKKKVVEEPAGPPSRTWPTGRWSNNTPHGSTEMQDRLIGCELDTRSHKPLPVTEAIDINKHAKLWWAFYDTKDILAELTANHTWTWRWGNQPAQRVAVGLAGRAAKPFNVRHEKSRWAATLYVDIADMLRTMRTTGHPDFVSGGPYYAYGILMEHLYRKRANTLNNMNRGDAALLRAKWTR